MSSEFIQNHLFKPFSTTKANGFGIGLYQSKSILEAHGGRIQAFSQRGQGSSFKIFLPIAGLNRG
ncbi:MAG: ATP-binding protein [Nitrospira sp.]|nr:ATP-binding protein [Nitrospira sp.]